MILHVWNINALITEMIIIKNASVNNLLSLLDCMIKCFKLQSSYCTTQQFEVNCFIFSTLLFLFTCDQCLDTMNMLLCCKYQIPMTGTWKLSECLLAKNLVAFLYLFYMVWETWKEVGIRNGTLKRI